MSTRHRWADETKAIETCPLNPDHRAVLMRIDSGSVRGLDWTGDRITSVVEDLIAAGTLIRIKTPIGNALQLTPIGQRILDRIILPGRYIATNKSVAEIADAAGLSVADLRPLDTALPGDDVQLPEHVEAALAPVLGRKQTTPGKKRTIPLIGRRGSGSPIQYGAVSETLVKALMGGRMRTVPEMAESLMGVNKAGTRETVGKALRRLEIHGITTEIGGDPPRRWCLTPAGEEAGKLLEGES